MPERERDYRNREISWSEIDKRRDRSRHVSRDEERTDYRKDRGKAEWLRKLALREANKHFQGKQGTPAHDQAVSRLQEHLGTKKFKTLAKKYLEEYGRPEHWGTQYLFLDYPDPELVTDLLRRMAEDYPNRSLREQQAFLSKLRTLRSLAEDGEVRELSEEILAALSAVE